MNSTWKVFSLIIRKRYTMVKYINRLRKYTCLELYETDVYRKWQCTKWTLIHESPELLQSEPFCYFDKHSD